MNISEMPAADLKILAKHHPAVLADLIREKANVSAGLDPARLYAARNGLHLLAHPGLAVPVNGDLRQVISGDTIAELAAIDVEAIYRRREQERRAYLAAH
jgi:hypothetical protein